RQPNGAALPRERGEWLHSPPAYAGGPLTQEARLRISTVNWPSFDVMVFQAVCAETGAGANGSTMREAKAKTRSISILRAKKSSDKNPQQCGYRKDAVTLQR